MITYLKSAVQIRLDSFPEQRLVIEPKFKYMISKIHALVQSSVCTFRAMTVQSRDFEPHGLVDVLASGELVGFTLLFRLLYHAQNFVYTLRTSSLRPRNIVYCDRPN